MDLYPVKTSLSTVGSVYLMKYFYLSSPPACYPACEHGGSCVGGLYCECFDGYSGDHCQISDYG